MSDLFRHFLLCKKVVDSHVTSWLMLHIREVMNDENAD